MAKTAMRQGSWLSTTSKTGNASWKKKKDFDQVTQQEPCILLRGWATAGDGLAHAKPIWTSDAPKIKLHGWVTEIVSSQTEALTGRVVSADNFGPGASCPGGVLLDGAICSECMEPRTARSSTTPRLARGEWPSGGGQSPAMAKWG